MLYFQRKIRTFWSYLNVLSIEIEKLQCLGISFGNFEFIVGDFQFITLSLNVKKHTDTMQEKKLS